MNIRKILIWSNTLNNVYARCIENNILIFLILCDFTHQSGQMHYYLGTTQEIWVLSISCTSCSQSAFPLILWLLCKNTSKENGFLSFHKGCLCLHLIFLLARSRDLGKWLQISVLRRPLLYKWDKIIYCLRIKWVNTPKVLTEMSQC